MGEGRRTTDEHERTSGARRLLEKLGRLFFYDAYSMRKGTNQFIRAKVEFPLD